MGNSKDSESLNIVLLPDVPTQEIAINLSNKLANRFPTEFTLNQSNLLPHITLYQAEFPKENLEKIKSVISEISSQIKPFKITLSNFSFLSTFIFWNFGNKEKIQKLHEKIVSELNPLRNNLIMKDLLNVNEIYPGARADVQKFGSLLIGKNYLPHLTISCLKNENDRKEALKLLDSQEEITYEVKTIYLGKLGKFGTVSRLLDTF